jgi:hypothetical protein
MQQGVPDAGCRRPERLRFASCGIPYQSPARHVATRHIDKDHAQRQAKLNSKTKTRQNKINKDKDSNIKNQEQKHKTMTQNDYIKQTNKDTV